MSSFVQCEGFDNDAPRDVCYVYLIGSDLNTHISPYFHSKIESEMSPLSSFPSPSSPFTLCLSTLLLPALPQHVPSEQTALLTLLAQLPGSPGMVMVTQASSYSV